ncbi:D-alanyl-D-alanine carboxypeptidase [Phenylobacterium montanum]|uniref:D-alanyl-D-alanine carboxypeptidase n=1 Tax=Phenylobacterium montanum TaxID=2823693 RepID=A0A975IUZ3_9CAUL|nr:D-alanyl-D-alanine carboxypeptidase [Caulobacter sp. S6]QUD88457.1 D-alanyl-D-alanine carboxypeptidase [Caulobacter sp. S6]
MYQPARSLFAAFGLGLAALSGVALPSLAHATPAGVTESKYAAIVMDASNGEVLYAHNADARRYPASITKVMTLYLAFEALSNGRLKLDDPVYVSAHAASMSPTKLGVPAGGSVTVDEAIRAMTVHSANDMAVALAEKLGGSEAKFTALMTLRAQELGMTNTHYVSACGLPDARQVTSAHDLAILARAMMRDYPQYYGYFSLKSFSYHGRTMVNTNHLLNDMPGVDGIKTGFTNASGFNLAASAVRDNHRLIVVVLGGSSSSGRNHQVENLLDTGFSVMHRRDAGERIAVAQNIFEPGSAPEATEAAAKVVLTDSEVASLRAAETPAKKPAVQTAEARIPASPAQARLIRIKAEEDSEHRTRRGHGEWRVQVGSYKLKSQAQAQLATIQRRYGEAVDGAHGSVSEAGRHAYNVRFTGFSAASAKEACHLMRTHRQACLAMPPES